MSRFNESRFQLDRARSFLNLQLLSAGYYCIQPESLTECVLIAGKEDSGFVALFYWADEVPKHAPIAEAPANLAFLKLPVRHILVSSCTDPAPGHNWLTVMLDADLVEALPVHKPGQLVILQVKKPL